ncbi:MAG: hypothetical protein Q8934_09810 [Bacillota bacterium]|nr:hypothetical protein [Bacillota bacterium]
MGKFIPTLNDIRGITFYIDNPQQSEILLNGEPIDFRYISYNNSDYTGRKSIGIKWFYRNVTDYKQYLLSSREPYRIHFFSDSNYRNGSCMNAS